MMQGHPPLSATPTSPPQGGRWAAALSADFAVNIGAALTRTRAPVAETHKTISGRPAIVETPAPRRSPLLRGRCPAGQRGVAPHGGLPHA